MLKKIFVTMFLSGLIVLSINQSAFAMRQTGMERSLSILQNAERVLRGTATNKGGHRYKALNHIQKAIYEIREGIDYANRRSSEGRREQRRRTEPPARNPRANDYGERERRTR